MAETRSKEKGFLRRFLKPLLAMSLGLFLSVAAAEVVLSIWWPQPTFSHLDDMLPQCYEASSITPFRLHPGARTRLESPEFSHAVVVNGQGLRMDREVAREKPEGFRRILVLGDSFAFGWGVAGSEAFPAILERKLRARGMKVEVLNLGFAMGPSPDSYYAGLRDDPRFDADIVVTAFFVGNDIATPGVVRWARTDDRGLPLQVINDLWSVDDEHRLRQSETLWRYRIPLVRDSHLVIGILDKIDGILGREHDDSALAEVWNPPELYLDEWPESLVSSFEKSMRCLVGINDLVKERGQEFLVMVIPHLNQIYSHEAKSSREGEQTRVVRRFRGLDEARVPQRRLDEALSAEGIEMFDLVPALLRSKEMRLYYTQDGHFTARGHAVAAGALERELLRRGTL